MCAGGNMKGGGIGRGSSAVALEHTHKLYKAHLQSLENTRKNIGLSRPIFAVVSKTLKVDILDTPPPILNENL